MVNQEDLTPITIIKESGIRAMNNDIVSGDIDSTDINSMPLRSMGVLNLGDRVEENDHSEEEIRAVLNSKFWSLRFPKALEAKYRTYYRPRALKSFHFRAPIILLLYVILISGIIKLLPDNSFLRWINIYGWVAVVVAGAWVMSYFSIFDRWFEWYVTIGCLICVGLSVAVANVIAPGVSTILSHAGIMYAMILIYSFVGLRFPLAVFAGWAGGVLGFILTHQLHAEMDWQLLHRTYTGTSILGMCMAYALDRQERTNFLQACLLQQAVINGERLANQLDGLSRQDALTGLANRRHLDEMMNHEWNRALRQQQSLVLMIIDVDYFKHYNDKLGHVAGDECLRKVGQLIHSLAKRSGELAARYGGEEFVLLFPSMEGDVAEQQAQRLIERMTALSIPHPDGENQHVTFSIGVSVAVPTPETSIDQLLRQADAALYKAKANGRNRYEFFSESMRKAAAVEEC
ncbi:GGDEF domain-containing protein [Aquirhabdus parva]|uniref:diguanylate cyclase n=2 Tax=Aquirhabdus parva TaxID=2283318 RepID=A0A345P4J7_9GAMM|nr:GGDEF domain-containing protein [Aquirhabdus parva]